MKRRTEGRAFLPLLAALGALFLSCAQDGILYHIQQETEEKDALIGGSPGWIITFENSIHVANGRVYKYDAPSGTGGKWERLSPQPPGVRVQCIAATTGALYALTSGSGDLGSNRVYSWDNVSVPPKWDEVPNLAGDISSIHAADDTLFVGWRNGGITYLLDGGSSGNYGQTGTLLAVAHMGAGYYVSIAGKGIFYSSSPGGAAGEIDDSKNKGNFTRFALDGSGPTLYAISSGSILAVITGPGVAQRGYHSFSGCNFTGALAFYEKSPTEKYLLAGRRYSGSYTNGYVEINVSGPGDPFVEEKLPGTVPNDHAHYNESLGRRVVNGLYVNKGTSGTSPPEFFAATNLRGLWVCLNGKWAAEDRGK